MRVLVACECSGVVREAFRSRGIDPYIWQEMENAAAFYNALADAKIDRIAIENSVMHGYAKRLTVRPIFAGWVTQIIQPHQFGENASKATRLQLKNLPPLKPTSNVAPRMIGGKPRWENQTDSGQNRLGPSPTRSADRTKTYQGIANAMAEQWGVL